MGGLPALTAAREMQLDGENYHLALYILLILRHCWPRNLGRLLTPRTPARRCETMKFGMHRRRVWQHRKKTAAPPRTPPGATLNCSRTCPHRHIWTLKMRQCEPFDYKGFTLFLAFFLLELNALLAPQLSHDAPPSTQKRKE